MKDAEHLNNELLIRYLDEELTEQAMAEVRNHLASCEACRQRRGEFATVSSSLEVLARASSLSEIDGSRGRLAAQLAETMNVRTDPNPSQVMKRFGWGMALAATLALGILISPTIDRRVARKASTPAPASTSLIDIDGESFIALPYSNPDLPLNAPRVVEMQVPVSSLEAAGIFLQPLANGAPDRTVLANVLLGIDGQPLGVHVLSAD